MPDTNHESQIGPVPDETFRLICERAAMALVATDTDLNVCVWNSAAGRLFGASAPQMIGAPLLSVLPAAQRAEAGLLLRRAVTNHEVSELEFSQRDEEGERRYFAAVFAPIVDPGEATLGASMWVRDVTRRTKLFQEVAQGRKMVSLGEMAGAVAHHFNNILGGIVTSVDFALDADDPAIERRVLIQTGRSLARATRLVDSLLAFAEGDRRSEDLADLTEVLLSELDKIEPELARADIQLKLDVRPVGIAAVPGKQIRSAVQVFVQNAVDAMPEGGTLSVSLRESGDCCKLTVTDTGCGVSEENLDRIFEPFFSTKPALSGSGDKALGLGLAIAHGIINELGGRISVRSEVSAGTLFEVHIPINRTAIHERTPKTPRQG